MLRHARLDTPRIYTHVNIMAPSRRSRKSTPAAIRAAESPRKFRLSLRAGL
jgi:hypothetical protein